MPAAATLWPSYTCLFPVLWLRRQLPSSLAHLATQAASLVDLLKGLMEEVGSGQPRNPRPYQPDAALINYYYEGEGSVGRRHVVWVMSAGVFVV